jgi:hypothetical protein
MVSFGYREVCLGARKLSVGILSASQLDKAACVGFGAVCKVQ